MQAPFPTVPAPKYQTSVLWIFWSCAGTCF